MLSTFLHAARLLVNGVVTGPGRLVVAGGTIRAVAVGRDVRPEVGDVVLPDGLLTPGLIDVQINGAFGVDFASARPEEWSPVRAGLARTGVTAFVPTVITAPVADLAAALAGIDRAAAMVEPGAARILGGHVEGPFLAPEYPGAHDPVLLTDPTPQALDVLLSGPVPAIVTLAPERPGALDAVRRLRAAGSVVSVGHTAATAAQVHAAAEAGARMVTHVFNAQRPLGHREPGAAGAALTDSRLTVGLIADLLHVAGEIVALVFRAVAGRVVLVTDAVAAMGASGGTAPQLGGTPVLLDGAGLARRPDGRIAGSVLRLDQAVRNAVACGVPPAAALAAATSTPADLLGRPDLGRLRAGAAADLVWWSDGLEPRQVWLAGQPVAAGRSGSDDHWDQDPG